MAGLDKILYFTRERLLSSDLNEQERISSRSVLDALMYIASTRFGVQDNEVLENASATLGVVLGGLHVQPGTGGVVITPGMLAQPYPGGTGQAPSLDESSYVMGEQLTVRDLAIATPGANTWFLVQARATTLITNATREEWDPGTETFSSVVFGRKLENVIEFNAKAGTATNIPLPDAGWLPLAGVFRPSTGEDPTVPDMIDLRPLYAQELEPVTQQILAGSMGVTKDCTLRTAHYQGNDVVAGDTVAFRFNYQGDFGRMFAECSTLQDITAAAFKDPSVVFAADTWYYLYLAKWGAENIAQTSPRSCYTDIVNQGVLVISNVAPSVQGSDVMPAGVTLPAPFSTGTLRKGVCVGMLQRNTANTGWQGCFMTGNRYKLIAFGGPCAIGGNSPQTFASGAIPRNARALTVEVTSTGVPAPSGISFFRSGTFLGGEMMGSVEIGVQDDGHMITVPLVGVDTTVMNLRRGGGTDPLSAIVEEMEI